MRVLLKVFVHPTFHGAVYSKMVILRRKPHITNRPGTWCPPAVLIQRSSQSIPVGPQLRSAQLQLWLLVPQQESWALGCWLGKWSWMCVCWRCCSLGCPQLTAGQRLVSLPAGAHKQCDQTQAHRHTQLQSNFPGASHCRAQGWCGRKELQAALLSTRWEQSRHCTVPTAALGAADLHALESSSISVTVLHQWDSAECSTPGSNTS